MLILKTIKRLLKACLSFLQWLFSWHQNFLTTIWISDPEPGWEWSNPEAQKLEILKYRLRLFFSTIVGSIVILIAYLTGSVISGVLLVLLGQVIGAFIRDAIYSQAEDYLAVLESYLWGFTVGGWIIVFLTLIHTLLSRFQ